MRVTVLIALFSFLCVCAQTGLDWTRTNQLGYNPAGVKVAVLCSKREAKGTVFQIIDAKTSGIGGRPGKRVHL